MPILRAVKLVFVLTLIAVMSGCATMDESECLYADWQETGYNDGVAGETRDYLNRRAGDCANFDVTPDKEAYLEGYDHGIEDFCTTENGYEKGRSGHNYRGVCPSHLEGLFLLGYQEGKVVYELEKSLAQYESAIADRARQLDNLHYHNYIDERILNSSEASEQDRRAALSRIRYRQRQSYVLRQEIFSLQQYQRDISAQLMQLNQRGWGR